MIPEGKYQAKATGGEFGVKNDKDFCAVNFEITEGELMGETITAWLYFSTDKNTERSIESLRYCGCTFPGNDITNLAGLGSRECQIVIAHETFEGKTRAKVQWVNSGGVGGMKSEDRMNPGQRKSFAERMKATLVASGKSGGEPSAADRVRETVSKTLGGPGNSDVPW